MPGRARSLFTPLSPCFPDGQDDVSMAPAPTNHLERLDDGVMELLASLLRPRESAAISECSRWGIATFRHPFLDGLGGLRLRWPGPTGAVATPVSRTPGQTLAGLLRRHPQARTLYISDFNEEFWEAFGEALRIQPCLAVEELNISWRNREPHSMGLKAGIQLGAALAGQALPALKEMFMEWILLVPEAASCVFEPLSNPDNCPAFESLTMDKVTCDDDHVLALALTSALRRRSERGGRGLKSISLLPAGPGATEIFLNGGGALTTLEDVYVDLEWDPFSTDVIQAMGDFLARTRAPALARLNVHVAIDGSLGPIFDAIRAGAAPRLRFLGIDALWEESVLQLAAAFESGSLSQAERARTPLPQPRQARHDAPGGGGAPVPGPRGGARDFHRGHGGHG
jgi:hypothetical protein